MQLDPKARAEILRRIQAAEPEVDDVLLFGSRARGDARADSDVDLLVLLPADRDKHAAAIRMRLALWGVGLGFDILVLTPEEFAQWHHAGGWFQREVAREAVRLHEAA